MKFWNMTVFNADKDVDVSFILQAPPYKKSKIIDIISGVHPEYSNFRLESIEKPAHIKEWAKE
ncbi:MAG: hypothetical protein CME70_19415 [Halobacteriovorax sp.]|nr:hypothetical protein [Halobacteriovorax sp.]MBK26176.1 hypothetical protein [Halobacteriovorax sp.]|tara:strand:+ start:3029 stop:3217 length:189 start_codon:yes stop_codon:yes gene_type:complete